MSRKQKAYVHIISDSTGETAFTLAKAVFSQFEKVSVKYYVWSLIGTAMQVERVIRLVKKRQGLIFHTLSNPKLSIRLKELCFEERMENVDAMEVFVKKVSDYLNQKPKPKTGNQHVLNKEYFAKIDAINFTMAHDDGQSAETISEADIIIFGPSRTSKSPTALYLAHKGLKTANIPFIEGIKPNIEKCREGSFVVGFTISVDRLIEVRRNRLLSLGEHVNLSYISEEGVASEVRGARRFFLTNHIPMIDITNKSIEETAAKIIQLYQLWKEKKDLLVNQE